MKRLFASSGRFGAALGGLLSVGICLFGQGCSPRLASVGTEGLLTRSFSNYSQSTVVRSERLAASDVPLNGSRTPVPKKETTPYGANAGERVERKRSQVIAPEGYGPQAPAPGEGARSSGVAPRSAGIPKATDRSVAGFRNMRFVTEEEARLVQSISETAPEERQPQPEAQPKTQQPQPNTQSQPVSQQPVRHPAASTRVSAVVPKLSKREQRALDKRRRTEAKRLLAERQAAAEAAARREREQAQQRVSERPAGEPVGEASVRTVPVAELQERLRQTSADRESAPSVARVSQSVIVPGREEQQKRPEPVREPSGEHSAATGGGAAEGPGHPFEPAETEHVKFSYYDPFGQGNNRFVVVLHEQHFCYPYPGRFLSGYGPRGRGVHTGVDIKGVKNDTVRAAFAGTVRMSKYYSGYGNCVVIRHKNGLETLYGHNTANLVRVGDAVRAGDPIGLIGRTGRATTEHCHFEVRIQGQHINPALILDCQNMTLRSGVLAVTRQANGRILATNRASGLAPSQAMDTEDEEGTATASAAAPAQASKGTSSGSTAGSVYTVRSGDTLWGIARRFGTTVSKLCDLNHLDREATLPLGKKLKVR